MYKRIALMTALLLAPLALSPASADAQDTGIDRARAASADAQATGRPDAMPPGMENRAGQALNQPSGQALPPGLMLTRPQAPADEPSVEPTEPEPEPEECLVDFAFVDGQWRLVDCDGNVIS